MTINRKAIHNAFQIVLIVGGAYAFSSVNAPWFFYIGLCVPAFFIGCVAGSQR